MFQKNSGNYRFQEKLFTSFKLGFNLFSLKLLYILKFKRIENDDILSFAITYKIYERKLDKYFQLSDRYGNVKILKIDLNFSCCVHIKVTIAFF